MEEILRDSLDTSALKLRLAEFAKFSRPIRWLANGLFAYLFGVIPVAVWTLGLALSWPALLAALLALTVSIAILFRRAHRELYPGEADERFTHFLIVLLSPVSAIRVQDLLSRPLLVRFHPLAIAFAVCPREEFLQLAERLWRHLSFGTPPADACSEAELALRHSRAALGRAVEAFLKECGVQASDLAKPPAPADETCRAYCPNCLAQFTSETAICSDCGGLKLMAFPDAPEPRSG